MVVVVVDERGVCDTFEDADEIAEDNVEGVLDGGEASSVKDEGIGSFVSPVLSTTVAEDDDGGDDVGRFVVEFEIGLEAIGVESGDGGVMGD